MGRPAGNKYAGVSEAAYKPSIYVDVTELARQAVQVMRKAKGIDLVHGVWLTGSGELEIAKRGTSQYSLHAGIYVRHVGNYTPDIDEADLAADMLATLWDRPITGAIIK